MNKTKNLSPALTLMILAPVIAEILPGATRLSTIFVLPVEMLIWGGGALMIRYAVRKWNLGWTGMLFLALALSVAEEFLIQQTSVAPMFLQLKGVPYARALGVNYVYLSWALIYESVFVVFLPVYITELIFANRRKELWISKSGLISLSILFLIGSFFAWYTWTQIARPQGFHVEIFNPPLIIILTGIALICSLVTLAFISFGLKAFIPGRPLKALPYLVLGIAGGLWAILLYGIILLAFGILPAFPPGMAVLTGLFLAFIPLFFLPRMSVHSGWNHKHVFSLVCGTISGSMIAGFIGFLYTVNYDLYFKILINILAVVLLIYLKRRVWKNTEQDQQTIQ